MYSYELQYENDKAFKFVVDEIQESLIDNAESQLQTLIGDGNTAAILFFLKTKAKARGYIERQEQDITSKGEKISININLDEQSIRYLIFYTLLNNQ